ncbi:MAG: glycosyltransferase family 39 protein, partial [Planctomycetaceae bacterium]|jgi:4-amino-4-deoxy-L-arabinose transferase-like glycosyltransferase|nr:glycosyltransferase family 39 protein [Planctomycetaceae bacterium]
MTPYFQNIFSGETRQNRIFLFITAIFFHVLFWTIAPTFFLSNYQIDTMEMMVIGQNWVISTFKHPAFQGWVVEIISRIFNRAEFVPYLVSQFACVLTIIIVWRFAQKILSPKLALLAALTLLSYFYFHYDSTVYNNRTFMRFFWIAAVYFLYLAFENNKKRYWILTGVMLGLGIYCKFTIFVLVITILLYMFFEPQGRKYWKTWGPYFSTVICFLIVLPLLIWIVQHHLSQFNYMFNSIGKEKPELIDHFFSPVRFLLSQIPVVAVLLIPVYPIIGFCRRFDATKYRIDFTGRFLTFFIFVPFILQVLVAFFCAGNMRTALGCHLWLLFPLYLLYTLKIPAEKEKFYSCSIKLVFGNIFIFALMTIFAAQFAPFLTERDSRYHFPGKELAQTVQTIWSERYSTLVPFVRGDDSLTETVAVNLQHRPIVYSELWSTEEDFRKRGGVLLWLIGEPGKLPRHSIRGCFGNRDFGYSLKTGQPDDWLQQFPNAEILTPLELAPKTITKVPPIKIGIAIIPPSQDYE